ncbi:hypothetical protein IE979_12625 [Klebsiella pneumoniae]|uniref:Uncharacterized protein n=2 Tax=Klebsiella pneumoniae TaxID=573 RepID=A0A927HHK5_KLEPN|nr:hypothetical protein [Klebsiella pneumoniae]QPG07339.1 hypothetical protein IUJ34_15235 [Klebsiella pneumoniae subsp. pneumoniae]MBD3703067.1 hypothetical protein [Klebsiella pneumoniae]MBD3705370.1 hypothetical protein [Klebsiella pneumoniae]MBD3716022.1 hypothetical protein [Klebsiella pneumoniae]
MAVPYRLRTQSGGESVKERGNQKQFAILQINAVGCKRYLFLSNQQGTQKQKMVTVVLRFIAIVKVDK